MSDTITDVDAPPPFVAPEGIESYGGRPGLATTICAFLLVASCAGTVATPRSSPPSTGAMFAGELVGGALVGAVLWGIAYAITIKRASPRARWVSLAVLMVIGFVTNAIVLTKPRADAATADRREAVAVMDRLVANGATSGTIVPSAQAGPITRLLASASNRTIAEAKAFDQELEASGMTAVMRMEGMTPTSPILDRCDRQAALVTRAEANTRQSAEVAAGLRREGDAAVARGEMTRAEFDAFIGGMARGMTGGDRQWVLSADIVRDGVALCRLLSKRRWTAGADGKVMFDRTTDLAEAKNRLAMIALNAAQLDALNAQNRQRAANEVGRLR